MGSPIDVGGQYPFITFFTPPRLSGKFLLKGCKFNVVVEWETGEKTYEPLSILAADDPVTCATYAKENDLLHIEGWKRLRDLARRDKL